MRSSRWIRKNMKHFRIKCMHIIFSSHSTQSHIFKLNQTCTIQFRLSSLCTSHTWMYAWCVWINHVGGSSLNWHSNTPSTQYINKIFMPIRLSAFQLSVLNSQPSRCSFHVKDLCLMIFKICSMLIWISQRNFIALNPNWEKSFIHRSAASIFGRCKYAIMWFGWKLEYLSVGSSLLCLGPRMNLHSALHRISKYFATVFSFEIFPRDQEFPFHKMSLKMNLLMVWQKFQFIPK